MCMCVCRYERESVCMYVDECVYVDESVCVCKCVYNIFVAL